jgi:hypothetical protein
MNAMFRKSLIAGAIAALASSPTWAADTDADKAPTPSATDQTLPGSQSMEPGAAPGTSAAQIGDATSNPLYSMTPQQLRKMDVVDATGKDIGGVHSVVHGRDKQDIQVIVSSGGRLGIGDKKVAVSLDELQLVDDKLHLSATKDELEARGEYVADQYVELEPKDQPISEFSAFESAPPDASRSPAAPSTTDPAQGSSAPPMGTERSIDRPDEPGPSPTAPAK